MLSVLYVYILFLSFSLNNGSDLFNPVYLVCINVMVSGYCFCFLCCLHSWSFFTYCFCYKVWIMVLICLIPYILSELMLWSLDIVSVTYVVCIHGLNSNTLPCVIVVFVIYSEYGSDLFNYIFLFWISDIVSLDIASVCIMVLILIPSLVLSVLYV